MSFELNYYSRGVKMKIILYFLLILGTLKCAMAKEPLFFPSYNKPFAKERLTERNNLFAADNSNVQRNYKQMNRHIVLVQ